MTPRIAVA